MKTITLSLLTILTLIIIDCGLVRGKDEITFWTTEVERTVFASSRISPVNSLKKPGLPSG